MSSKKTVVNIVVPPVPMAFKSMQTDLFQSFLVNNDAELEPLSNTIDLWDRLPKYSVSQVEQNKIRTKEGLLPLHRRDVLIKDCPYTIFISPALLADEEGRAYYPSANEELVEDALRKIATLQNQCFFDERESHCGVTFTLHQLRTELKERGHSRSYQQIIKSLYILAGADIEIRTKQGKGVSIEKYMSLTGFTESERLDNPNSKWVCYFHSLVRKAMNSVGYRQYNYQQMMQLESHLARWLYKRLAHYWTNAGALSPITLSFAEIRSETGMLERSRTNDAVKELEAIFQIFIDKKIFRPFKRMKEVRGERNKIIDIFYEAYPHEDFIKSVKAANRRQADSKEILGEEVNTGYPVKK
jgi:hypothetical protein